MEDNTASSLKTQGIGLGIASGAAIPAFEIFTGGKGIISIIAGAGTLGYGAYRYSKDTTAINKNRNIGDSVADIFDIGVDAAKGAAWGLGHIYLVAAIAGGAIVVYLLSGMVKVQTTTTIAPSTIPAILGGVMGLSGGVLLFIDGESIETAKNPDVPHSIAHDVVETGKQAFSNDVKNMKAATTASGWTQFEYNISHPQDYFPAYGQRVKQAWNNINSVGSFFNAWTTTFSIVGDMFSTDSKTPYNPASEQPLTSNTYDDWLATHPIADDSQREAARIFFGGNK